MKIEKLSNMTRGWFIGNFDPSLLKTKQFEVGVLSHKAGEYWAPHKHSIATEYNVLVSGRMRIAGRELVAGDIFWFEPDEVADPVFIEDCVVCVVKVPSVPGDKYEVL